MYFLCSISFPVTSVVQDAMCLSNSGSDDSEKPPANLDLTSRKRFHCRPDESDYVLPAKKCSLTSRDNCQKYTSEVRESLSKMAILQQINFCFFLYILYIKIVLVLFIINNSSKTSFVFLLLTCST